LRLQNIEIAYSYKQIIDSKLEIKRPCSNYAAGLLLSIFRIAVPAK